MEVLELFIGNQKPFESKVQVFNEIVGDFYTRGSGFDVTGIFTRMMEIARYKKHFVADIIYRAVCKQSISEKQAWCVAYFAEKNGFIK